MEVSDVMTKIQVLSEDLDNLGNTLRDMSNQMYDLKRELFVWDIDQSDDIRSKERAGKLPMKDGHTVKLTDAVRASLVQYGKKDKFADYEALKRKRDVLLGVVKAKTGALSGYQTMAGILKKEFETLHYQT